MNNAIPHKQLCAVLHGEIVHAQELLATLKREHRALIEHSTEDIKDTAAVKERLIRDLEELSVRQREILREGGIDQDKTDLNAYFNRPGRETLHRQYQELYSLLSQCHHQNRINGGIIEMGQHFTQQILDILHGVSAESKLYGPTGKTRTVAGKATLAQA